MITHKGHHLAEAVSACFGFTDDIAAILACIKAVKSNITPAVKEQATKKLNDWFKDIELEKVEGFHKEIDEQ